MVTQTKKIINLYTVGKITKKEASDLLDISERTFERKVNSEGFSKKNHIINNKGVYFSRENITYWRNLHKKYMEGDSLRDLGNEVGLSHMVISKQFKKFNFELKSNLQLNNERVTKMKNNFLGKFKVDHHLKTEEGKDKLKSSVRKKYGVDNVMQLKEVQDTIRSSVREKYGVDSVMQVKEILDKNLETKRITREAKDAAKKKGK
ncbi:hypothetical protein N9948_02160 [bacterium]|nr:hypothetical protein [bacterium]